MIPRLFRRPDPTIATLYGAIVTQSRSTRFYESYGVPDTILGRFDLILLHLALVLRRLRGGEGPARDLAQDLFDAFCRDMDHNLREMGIGDQGVPRQMRRVGEAFYGRAQAYDEALAQPGNEALVATLIRNVYAEAAESTVAAERLAAYVRRAVDELDARSIQHLLGGAVTFPEPVALAALE
jgi:cytochrome b pre-mRNA-processing protein 3